MKVAYCKKLSEDMPLRSLYISVRILHNMNLQSLPINNRTVQETEITAVGDPPR
jgi:hypothetical protein